MFGRDKETYPLRVKYFFSLQGRWEHNLRTRWNQCGGGGGGMEDPWEWLGCGDSVKTIKSTSWVYHGLVFHSLHWWERHPNSDFVGTPFDLCKASSSRSPYLGGIDSKVSTLLGTVRCTLAIYSALQSSGSKHTLAPPALEESLIPQLLPKLYVLLYFDPFLRGSFQMTKTYSWNR